MSAAITPELYFDLLRNARQTTKFDLQDAFEKTKGLVRNGERAKALVCLEELQELAVLYDSVLHGLLESLHENTVECLIARRELAIRNGSNQPATRSLEQIDRFFAAAGAALNPDRP